MILPRRKFLTLMAAPLVVSACNIMPVKTPVQSDKLLPYHNQPVEGDLMVNQYGGGGVYCGDNTVWVPVLQNGSWDVKASTYQPVHGWRLATREDFYPFV